MNGDQVNISNLEIKHHTLNGNTSTAFIHPVMSQCARVMTTWCARGKRINMPDCDGTRTDHAAGFVKRNGDIHTNCDEKIGDYKHMGFHKKVLFCWYIDIWHNYEGIVVSQHYDASSRDLISFGLGIGCYDTMALMESTLCIGRLLVYRYEA